MMRKKFAITHGDTDFSISALYRETGGPLVFFIHGLGCAGEAFLEAFSHPAMEGFSLLAVDLPGFGQSSKPHDFPYTMEEHAGICLKLLSSLSLGERKIHMVVHSMGSAVGLITALSLKKRLASFVNIEGNLVSKDCSIRRKIVFFYGSYRQRLIDRLESIPSINDTPGLALWARLIKSSSEEALNRSARSLMDWSCSGGLLEMFMSLNCPKIYVYGDKNRYMWILKKLSDIEKSVITGSGHFPMIDNSKDFYHLLGSFIGKAGKE